MIHVVGLGPGDPASLPPRAFALLVESNLPLLLRTARHPTLAGLALPAHAIALDDEYERGASFEETYTAIVERVLALQRERGEIVYAVPGHPLVGESTVARLLTRAKEVGVPVRIVGAPSFVDACLEALAEPVTGDLLVLDALSGQPIPRADGPILLYQVHSRQAASDTKLALMAAGYPDAFEVTVVRAAGIPGQESVRAMPLFALDRSAEHDHLTSVWVPRLSQSERRPTFPELVAVMARLRAPDGCPWDREQTHETLRKYVIEEAYEVVEAVDSGDPDQLCEELGDLLLQVVFHAQLASEDGFFDVDDVAAGIVEKLIRRHPHVFGDVRVAGSDEVLTNWQAIKATEKGNADRKSILDGIPKGLPALMQAMETSKRVVRVGFEWPVIDDVLAKVDEELAEVRAEIAANADAGRIGDEIGDLLFTLVNVARHLGIDAEEALRAQVARFGRRFRFIETRAAEQGIALETLGLERMEALWQEAKTHEK